MAHSSSAVTLQPPVFWALQYWSQFPLPVYSAYQFWAIELELQGS
jgi:hypothetical protein